MAASISRAGHRGASTLIDSPTAEPVPTRPTVTDAAGSNQESDKHKARRAPYPRFRRSKWLPAGRRRGCFLKGSAGGTSLPTALPFPERNPIKRRTSVTTRNLGAKNEHASFLPRCVCTSSVTQILVITRLRSIRSPTPNLSGHANPCNHIRPPCSLARLGLPVPAGPCNHSPPGVSCLASLTNA